MENAMQCNEDENIGSLFTSYVITGRFFYKSYSITPIEINLLKR